MRVAPRYTQEFRTDALALLRKSERSLRAVAVDLGLCPETLRGWYKQEEMAKKTRKTGKLPPGARPQARVVPRAAEDAEDAEERIARLERELAAVKKENESLRQDREILKKAAAFFVKESE
jgi:transposase